MCSHFYQVGRSTDCLWREKLKGTECHIPLDSVPDPIDETSVLRAWDSRGFASVEVN